RARMAPAAGFQDAGSSGQMDPAPPLVDLRAPGPLRASQAGIQSALGGVAPRPLARLGRIAARRTPDAARRVLRCREGAAQVARAPGGVSPMAPAPLGCRGLPAVARPAVGGRPQSAVMAKAGRSA